MKRIKDRLLYIAMQRRARARTMSARRRARKRAVRAAIQEHHRPRVPGGLGRCLNVPANFTVVGNPDGVLKVFDDAARIIDRNARVSIDVRTAEHVSVDSIAMLMAHLGSDKFRQGGRCIAIGPKPGEQWSEYFSRSGIYRYVKPIRSADRRRESRIPTEGSVETRTNTRVQPDAAFRIVNRATELLHGECSHAKGAYRILIECMANTWNHAAGDQDGVREPWWLTMGRVPGTDRVAFAFVDIGVGLFESRKVKSILGKLLGLRGFMERVGLLENPRIVLLRDMLAGEVESRTGLSYRGKGLPSMKKCLERRQISKLVIVANEVFADVQKDEYRILSTPLRGTFIYWELPKNSATEVALEAR